MSILSCNLVTCFGLNTTPLAWFCWLMLILGPHNSKRVHVVCICSSYLLHHWCNFYFLYIFLSEMEIVSAPLRWYYILPTPVWSMHTINMLYMIFHVRIIHVMMLLQNWGLGFQLNFALKFWINTYLLISLRILMCTCIVNAVTI